MKKRTLQELTLKDNFMFGAVMSDEDICREFLEEVLGFPIASVVVSKERSIVYRPEYKGVRLDIFAQDENNTHYNVEMQVAPKLKFVQRKCGAFFVRWKSDDFFEYLWKNPNEVPETLVRFLDFVKADFPESLEKGEDKFVRRLQKSIQRIKESREMEGKFMIFEEMLSEERTAGRAEGKIEGKIEGIIDLLNELGSVPSELKEKIMQEKDQDVLLKWLKLAAQADSVEQFEKSFHV